MILRALLLEITTKSGLFGFRFEFSRNLTIVKGDNSSGKSTFFNTLLYSLGMEELVGGKGPKVLTYAVKDYFEYDGERHQVESSQVLVELENQQGEVITACRAIHDEARDSKLVLVFKGAVVTEDLAREGALPTYLHDPGSATKAQGFHALLEGYLGLALPKVPTTSGGEAKLYLQNIFAALAIEQKRGWTDYIANIPFYGLREPRARVAEYLLGLDVFELNAARNRLNTESIKIDSAWNEAFSDLSRAASALSLTIEGVPRKVRADFDPSGIRYLRLLNDETRGIAEYEDSLRKEYESLEKAQADGNRLSGKEVVDRAEVAHLELQKLVAALDQAEAGLSLQRTSLAEYKQLAEELGEDLERNKTAMKLRDLGAAQDLDIAEDRCPTCHQVLEDSLLLQTIAGPQMDLEANIKYLESQARMMGRQIEGLTGSLPGMQQAVNDLKSRVAAKRDEVAGLRNDVASGANFSRGIFLRQARIESEVRDIQRFDSLADGIVGRLAIHADELRRNQEERSRLPDGSYSLEDRQKIALFQKMFRANAGSFGYSSAPIKEIEINEANLLPFLSQIELREIRSDIRSDSSASDFVRLIWSYLIGLYQTSSHPTVEGNHPGLLCFDEPGQHSMAEDSQHALLRQLSGLIGLQSIVAASFDQSESVFKRATDGTKFKLIEWEGKLVRPLERRAQSSRPQ